MLSRPSWAQEQEQQPPLPPETHPIQAMMEQPDTAEYMLQETPLGPADRMTQTPPNWTGDISTPGPAGFVQRHIEQHREFVQPFLDSAVFPDVTARVESVGGWNPRNGAGEMDQYGYLSFYFFELYAPLVTLRDSSPASTGHFRMNLRLPAMLSDHDCLSFFASAYIPTDGAWTASGGFSGYVGYAHGGTVSVQARAGVGYDVLVGELPNEVPLATSILYDAAIAYHLGRHFELIGQVDGRKLVARSGSTFRVFPGFRLFPLQQETLSVGVSGLYWMDDFNPGGVGSERTRRAGAFLDFGYLFL